MCDVGLDLLARVLEPRLIELLVERNDTIVVVPSDVLLGDVAEWIGIQGGGLPPVARRDVWHRNAPRRTVASGGKPRAPARARPM